MTEIQTLGGPLDTGQPGPRADARAHLQPVPRGAGLLARLPRLGSRGRDPQGPADARASSSRPATTRSSSCRCSASGATSHLMPRAVEGTGLQVTLATGLYTYDVLPRLWHFMGPGTLLDGDEPLDELFKRDIEEGIQGTDIKAAMLKCAVDHDGLTDHVAARPALVLPRPPPDRHPDDRPHARADRARQRRAEGARGGGRRPTPRRARPLRRQRRPRLPREAHRRAARRSAWTASG